MNFQKTRISDALPDPLHRLRILKSQTSKLLEWENDWKQKTDE